MNMRKAIAMALAAMLALTALASGALAEITYSTDGSFPICSETVHLTVGVPDNTLIEDWETNGLTKLIEERGNFDLEFVVFDSNDYASKLNLMVMAGGDELPDVILGSVVGNIDSMAYQWALEGAILPLTEYYNDPSISYYIHEAMDRTGTDFISQIKSPDGEIYGIPTYNQSYMNEYPHKGYYFKPWLETLGLEEPTTTQELYELFEKVCSQDMNGNGKADEIALTGTWGGNYDGWFAYLMNAFVYAGDTDYFTVQDGVVDVAYTTDAWKEGLKYIRSLFEAGFIPMETLTQDDASFKRLVSSEDPVAFMVVYLSTSMIDAALDYRYDFLPLSALIGPENVQYATFRPSVASISFVVTKNCKNPEAAFRMGDLLCAEDLSITARWGAEGTDWDYAENVENIEKYRPLVEGWPVYIVPYDDPTYWGSGTVQNAGWRQTGPYVRQYAIANGMGADAAAQSDIVPSYSYSIYQESGWNPDEVIPKLLYTAEETEAISEIRTTLLDYVKASTANFLAGNTDIDAGWEDFVAQCHTIGLDDVLSVVNEVYTRMYK
ncbi:MAG: extracellular solute-binding protein [Eubacteriales bacterium]|nr:extracellular solute-binding protein [Eubacteriales bacterium]